MKNINEFLQNEAQKGFMGSSRAIYYRATFLHSSRDFLTVLGQQDRLTAPCREFVLKDTDRSESSEFRRVSCSWHQPFSLSLYSIMSGRVNEGLNQNHKKPFDEIRNDSVKSKVLKHLKYTNNLV